jgi:protein-L-isoaspartate(D-aspartate) O-methyltransferase
MRWKRKGLSVKAVTFAALPPVDRRLFIPDDVWVVENETWVRVSRREDPTKWEHLVASEDAITTVLKDGMWPISSSSSPVVMAHMISVLKLKPGMRVLEIGTGTGWNAACLATLGAEVVSVEIDAPIAEQARINLQKAGYGNVVVVAGNGEQGVPESVGAARPRRF